MRRVDGLALFIIALVVGVGLRLYLAAAFQGNTDERYWELIAAIMRRGGNPYADPSVPADMPFGYPPTWALVLHQLDRVVGATTMPLHFVVRATLTVVDVANAALIGVIAHRTTGVSWHRGFAIYLLNPLAILLVGFHGQLETLAALPLLAATATWGRASTAMIWLLGTASLLVKHILVFSVWVMFWYAFRPTIRIVLVSLSGVVFALTLVPYWLRDPDAVVDKMLGHAGLPGIFGFSSLLPYRLAVVLFLVVMTVLPVVARRWAFPIERAMRLAAIAFLAFTFGIGEQYFLIPVLFGAAFAGRWYWIYSAVATLFLLSSFENVNVLPLPRVWNAVWIAALAWLASETIASERARSEHRLREAIADRVDGGLRPVGEIELAQDGGDVALHRLR